MADQERIADENRRIRLLRISSDMLLQVLMTRPLSAQEAERMIIGLRRFAATLFPGKEPVFDMIYLPRFRRALEEAGATRLPRVLLPVDENGPDRGAATT